MKISGVLPYLNTNGQNNAKPVNFGMASDITIEYAIKNHSKYLPKSMIQKIKELIAAGHGKRRLCEVHNEVYKDLFEAETLTEARSKYEELNKVQDVTTIGNNRSKAIKLLKKIMPLEKFTLDYIKKLYKPYSQDNLVAEYGFTNRSLLAWLNEKLHIQKLNGSYIKLLKMSDEKENQRIAELSRKAIYANEDAQKYRLQKAAETHRTPEYRAKKRQEMKDYYLRHPETAKKTSLISKKTWDRCPEIKEALSVYTKALEPYIRKILSKKQAGLELTPLEKKTASTYYREFWDKHPDYKAIYRERRLEVIKELKEAD